ncbi:MAG: sialate O-acetylesterase [Opitutaceae bacterium]
MKYLRLFSLWLAVMIVSRADVTLAPLFQDHAVLQRDQALPVWGRATPGEHVTVTFHDQTIGTTTAADGRWMVYLDAVPASAEPAELVVTGKNTLTVKDVLVGEVWLASGQSNMEWPLKSAANGEREVATANYPQLRLYSVLRTVAEQPAETATGSWQPCTPESVKMFSAVAYFFGRDLQRKLGVPVGIIGTYWGGTPIESWMSNSTLRSMAAWPAIDARWLKDSANFSERLAQYTAKRAAWDKANAVANATKTPNPLSWPAPPIGPGTPYALSVLFNAMIAPLQPYALRGVIWYQGEQNWPRPEEYAGLFPAMIRSWRAQWGQGDFPFYFVQLANFTVVNDPTHRAWARLRDAQASALALPATGMAVTIDIGNPKSIHPLNKQDVGRRLALIAKTQVYNIPGDFSGPRFAYVTGEPSAIRVHFTHAAMGLIAAGKPVQSLEVAGADQKFYPATGKIERDTLLVSSPQVKVPLAVRYAWSNAPMANLYNGAGLPAVPFRSDDW